MRKKKKTFWGNTLYVIQERKNTYQLFLILGCFSKAQVQLWILLTLLFKQLYSKWMMANCSHYNGISSQLGRKLLLVTLPSGFLLKSDTIAACTPLLFFSQKDLFEIVSSISCHGGQFEVNTPALKKFIRTDSRGVTRRLQPVSFCTRQYNKGSLPFKVIWDKSV